MSELTNSKDAVLDQLQAIEQSSHTTTITIINDHNNTNTSSNTSSNSDANDSNSKSSTDVYQSIAELMRYHNPYIKTIPQFNGHYYAVRHHLLEKITNIIRKGIPALQQTASVSIIIHI